MKKKPDNAAVPHDNCSLDLNPTPDRDLFGLKQSSEEESLESASDSEDSGSGSDTCSVTSEDQKAATETLEHEEKDPETGEWQLVTRRVLWGRNLKRRKYPFPRLAFHKSYRNNYFQDQDNKQIYMKDLFGGIHGPVNPETHTGWI